MTTTNDIMTDRDDKIVEDLSNSYAFMKRAAKLITRNGERAVAEDLVRRLRISPAAAEVLVDRALDVDLAA